MSLQKHKKRVVIHFCTEKLNKSVLYNRSLITFVPTTRFLLEISTFYPIQFNGTIVAYYGRNFDR